MQRFTLFDCILGVTVLLSLTVFQQIVSESMPITSLQIPLLGNYSANIARHNHLDPKIPYLRFEDTAKSLIVDGLKTFDLDCNFRDRLVTPIQCGLCSGSNMNPAGYTFCMIPTNCLGVI